tara:strand:+ start:89 stop:1675 length:1587 start_codon:yes stop_codon:yes gene_type:complete
MFKKFNLISNFNSENIFQIIREDEKKLKHFSFCNVLDVLNKNKKEENINIILFLQTNSHENNYLNKIIKFSQNKNVKSLNILIPIFYNLNEVLTLSLNNSFNSFQKILFEQLKNLKKKNSSNLILIDFLYLCSLYNGEVFNLKRWYLSKNSFSSDFEIYLCEKLSSIKSLVCHNRKKAIFVDLDDTLWGGTIAEDDAKEIKLGNMSAEGEAFQNFQELLRNYSKSGIILGIISRNYEKKALNFISKHPEMVLKKRDFAGWRINFNNKSDNIKSLCKELNIKSDSIVFLDNSNYERQEVEDKLNDVKVLDIGENVFEYANKLKNYLDISYTNLTKEDFRRAKNYSQIRIVKESQKNFNSHEDWLRSLKMNVEFEKFNNLQIERYHQMFNKINQINLSTRRLSKQQIKKEIRNKTKFITMRVHDKVSNLGIIGLISIREKNNIAVIKDFLFSCRALGRDLEKYFITKLTNHLFDKKVDKVFFNFKKTPKNKLCLELLNKMNITAKNNFIVKKKLSSIYNKNIFHREIIKF